MRSRWGQPHAVARAAAFAALPDWSLCARCASQGKVHRIYKWALDPRGKSALHYDHTDDRTGYLGFSHWQCNARAAAALGNRRRAMRRRLGNPSRNW